MLGLRLLEAHGFGEVEYPRWKAACLRERATLGECAHQAVGHKFVCYATWPSRTSRIIMVLCAASTAFGSGCSLRC